MVSVYGVVCEVYKRLRTNVVSEDYIIRVLQIVTFVVFGVRVYYGVYIVKRKIKEI